MLYISHVITETDNRIRMYLGKANQAAVNCRSDKIVFKTLNGLWATIWKSVFGRSYVSISEVSGQCLEDGRSVFVRSHLSILEVLGQYLEDGS